MIQLYFLLQRTKLVQICEQRFDAVQKYVVYICIYLSEIFAGTNDEFSALYF